MSRRDRQAMANRAAQAASEAGRTLQAQRSFQNEASSEPAPEPVDAAPDSNDNEGSFVQADPSKNPRNQAYEELVKLRNPDQPAETAPETPPEAAPVVQDVATVLDAPATEPEPPAPVKTVRVKVDGEEFDAPEDEVNEAGGIKPYQMLKASENRLKKTNEALAEARQQQAAIAQFLQQQANAAAQQTPRKTPSEELQEKIDLIRYGSPEESAAALQSVLDGQRVDPNQITFQAISAIRQQDAENAFVQEFADVVHNPMLLKLIIAEKNERIAKAAQSRQPITDWNHFYRSIGNEVRGAIGRQSQPAAAAQAAAAPTADHTSQVLSDKEARKASIVNLPTAAARAALPEADKPETRADVLNQMRKSRGLPTG